MGFEMIFLQISAPREETIPNRVGDELRPEICQKALKDHETRFIEIGSCKDFAAELIEFEGEKDYVHLLVNYPPKVSVSKLVNSLKGVSSRLVRKNDYPTVRGALWGNSLWSPSYFAGACGGAPLGIIRQYIEQQDSPAL